MMGLSVPCSLDSGVLMVWYRVDAFLSWRIDFIRTPDAGLFDDGVVGASSSSLLLSSLELSDTNVYEP